MLDPARHRRSLIERLAHIQETLSNLRARNERLTTGANELSRCLDELIPAVFQEFDQRWNALDSVQEPKRSELRKTLCNDIQELLHRLGSVYVPVLQGSHSTGVPVELEILVTSLVREVAPEWNLQPVLWGTSQYNYSVNQERDPITDWLSDGHGGVSEAAVEERDFLFLSLPTLERDAAPLHGILLGHELGHLRDWYNDISGSLQFQLPGELTDDTGELTLETAREAEVFTAVAKSWAIEIVADIFSAIQFGPAALLALPELASGGSLLNVDSSTHPGIDRRISVVCDVLRDCGFEAIPRIGELIAEYEDVVEGALDRDVALKELMKWKGPQLAWDWLRALIPELKDKCRAALAEGKISPSSWDQVDYAVKLLISGQPCGETLRGQGDVTPISIEAILNAAWMVRLDYTEALADEIGVDAETFEGLVDLSSVIDGLTLKSIEISAWRTENPWL